MELIINVEGSEKSFFLKKMRMLFSTNSLASTWIHSNSFVAAKFLFGLTHRQKDKQTREQRDKTNELKGKISKDKKQKDKTTTGKVYKTSKHKKTTIQKLQFTKKLYSTLHFKTS
jgi:hypothetical protein